MKQIKSIDLLTQFKMLHSTVNTHDIDGIQPAYLVVEPGVITEREGVD